MALYQSKFVITRYDRWGGGLRGDGGLLTTHDRGDPVGRNGEPVPGPATGHGHGGGVCEHLVGEAVAPRILERRLHRVEFGAIGRQFRQHEVGGRREVAASSATPPGRARRRRCFPARRPRRWPPNARSSSPCPARSDTRPTALPRAPHATSTSLPPSSRRRPAREADRLAVSSRNAPPRPLCSGHSRPPVSTESIISNAATRRPSRRRAGWRRRRALGAARSASSTTFSSRRANGARTGVRCRGA